MKNKIKTSKPKIDFATSNKNSRILHIFQTFFPATAFGGPIFSTKAIIDQLLPEREFEFTVLTTDAKKPKSYERLSAAETAAFSHPDYMVEYCRKYGMNQFSPSLLFKLWSNIGRSHVVHLTGSYGFAIFPAILMCKIRGKALIWSPRGGILATASWAGSPRKWLKRASEFCCRCVLPVRSTIHTTSLEEARVMALRFPKAEVCLLPNSVEIPKLRDGIPMQNPTNVELCFMSRLHPKKGLEILIEAVARLPENFHLNIYGNGEPKYELHLQKIVNDMSLTGRVKFHGFIEGAAKSEALWNASIFVLPTYSENFGIVVAEALAHSLPVITTDRAPWHEIEEYNCGAVISPSIDELVEAIVLVAAQKKSILGQNARQLVIDRYSRAEMGWRFSNLYKNHIQHES